MNSSYEHQNKVRDLSDVLSLVIQAEPTIISLLQTGGEPAAQERHEWQDLSTGTVEGLGVVFNSKTERNHTEIFDYTAKVSRTAQAVRTYGIADALDYQVQNGARIIARRMNNALIYGRRVERGDYENGTMGGLLEFLGADGGNQVDNAGGALSSAVLNDAIEQVFRRGGRPTAIACNTNQARQIDGFNTSNLQVERADTLAGQMVYRFERFKPMGMISHIVVDINFPRDKVAILDPNLMRIVPLKGRALNDSDITSPGSDYFSRRMLGEYTLEIKNAKKAHGIIVGLEV